MRIPDGTPVFCHQTGLFGTVVGPVHGYDGRAYRVRWLDEEGREWEATEWVDDFDCLPRLTDTGRTLHGGHREGAW